MSGEPTDEQEEAKPESEDVRDRLQERLKEESLRDAGDHWERRWPPVSYWAKVTMAVVLTVAVLLAARTVANVIILVVIAAVLAVGLDPAVRRVQSLGIRRGLAVTVIFFGVVLFIFLFGLLVVPPLVRQVSGLADDIPNYVARLEDRSDWLGRYFRRIDVSDAVRDFIAELPQRISSSFGTIVGFAGRVTGAVFNVVTVTILAIYFMLSLPSMRKTSAIAFTPDRRQQAERVMDQSIAKIGGYVSGNLTTSVICALLALVALLILGVPFAIPLAMWAGIADLIPAVGSYLGAIPAVAVAFFQSPLTGVAVLVYFIVYQQFENYVLVPRVMRNAVDLSPAAVIISTLIGGSLAGFAGALLALPVAATIKVIIYDMWLHDRVREGDVLVRRHLEAEARAEAEAEEVAAARAANRRRLLRSLITRRGRGRTEPGDR